MPLKKLTKPIYFRGDFVVSLFNDRSTFYAKVIFIEKQLRYNLTHGCRGDKVVHIFLNSIDPKVNVIAQLEFELTYYDVPVQHVSHHIMRTLFHIYSVIHLSLLIFFDILSFCPSLFTFSFSSP